MVRRHREAGAGFDPVGVLAGQEASADGAGGVMT
jgi:hypothetical protein